MQNPLAKSQPINQTNRTRDQKDDPSRGGFLPGARGWSSTRSSSPVTHRRNKQETNQTMTATGAGTSDNTHPPSTINPLNAMGLP